MMTLKEKLEKSSNKRTDFLLSEYFVLLKEWNEKMNLTAITEKEEVYLKHFADSLAALDIVYGKVLDVGAGAGFPSLPLKIFKESLNVKMIDSLNKRVTFLKEVINKLGLSGIEAEHVRAEDFKERESFDFVVARAVAPTVTLLEYMMPFVKVGGKAVCYKSGDIDEEIERAKKAVKVLGGRKIEKVEIMLDESVKRQLLIVEKIEETPKKYPRSGNKPRLSPIV